MPRNGLLGRLVPRQRPGRKPSGPYRESRRNLPAPAVTPDGPSPAIRTRPGPTSSIRYPSLPIVGSSARISVNADDPLPLTLAGQRSVILRATIVSSSLGTWSPSREIAMAVMAASGVAAAVVKQQAATAMVRATARRRGTRGTERSVLMPEIEPRAAAGIAIATPFTFTERILRDTIPNCCPMPCRRSRLSELSRPGRRKSQG